MLTINGVGDSPSGEFAKSGSSNRALDLVNDLLTAEGVMFIRFATLVTLRSHINNCGQSGRLRPNVVTDSFMSDDRASKRDEHNQQQAYYATGNRSPDQHIPCAGTNHRRQSNPQ